MSGIPQVADRAPVAVPSAAVTLTDTSAATTTAGRKRPRSPSPSTSPSPSPSSVTSSGGRANPPNIPAVAPTGDAQKQSHAHHASHQLGDDFLSFDPTPALPGRGGCGGSSGGAPKSCDSDELPPWLERPWSASVAPLVGLHNEILWFRDLVSPTPAEARARAAALGDVTGVLEGLFSGCSVQTFGSELTGLCLPSSDIDVACLGTPGAPLPVAGARGCGGGGGGGGAKPMHTFAEVLREKGLVSYLEVVEFAKVPIVKLVHAKTSVRIDVCFGEDSGLEVCTLTIRSICTYRHVTHRFT